MRNRRRLALTLVGVAVSGFFTYLAVRDVNLDAFWTGLKTSDYRWLIPALAVLAVGVWLRALRWWLLFPRATRPPLGAVTRALLAGYLFNNILPARAGELLRVVVLHAEARTSRAEALTTTVAERFYDIIALILLLLLASPFLPEISWLGPALIFGAIVLAAAAALVLVVNRWGTRPLLFLLRPLVGVRSITAEKVEEIAKSVVRGLVSLRHPRVAVPVFGVTVLSWLVVAVSFWCVVEGFDLGVGFGAALLMLIAVNLALVVPSLPAGIGVFEAACLVALRAYGVNDSEALSCIVVLHVINFVPYLIAGYLALTWHTRVRITKRDLLEEVAPVLVEERAEAPVHQVYR